MNQAAHPEIRGYTKNFEWDVVYHKTVLGYLGNPSLWYSAPQMLYSIFWILTMIPMPKIQKSFKQ